MLHQACDVSSPLIQMPLALPLSTADRIEHIRAQLDEIQEELRHQGADQCRLQQVRAYLAARRGARQAFGAATFSDPAWDMLVQLYAHHLAQQSIALSKLCQAAHVPTATGQRWIKYLEQTGHVARKADKHDNRRQWLALTDSGLNKMEAYFRTLM
jgi:DNA-binding MarR family transcriptional regulator